MSESDSITFVRKASVKRKIESTIGVAKQPSQKPFGRLPHCFVWHKAIYEFKVQLDHAAHLYDKFS